MSSGWRTPPLASRSTSPTSRTTCGRERRLTARRACAAPPSISPTAPCRCCRWSFRSEGRRDFRGRPVVTIDGETAKDFDDAVDVERLANATTRLSVHIADVAHYVRTGTALDREARLRGTSVYFPDRAVPMLPLELQIGRPARLPRPARGDD